MVDEHWTPGSRYKLEEETITITSVTRKDADVVVITFTNELGVVQTKGGKWFNKNAHQIPDRGEEERAQRLQAALELQQRCEQQEKTRIEEEKRKQMADLWERTEAERIEREAYEAMLGERIAAAREGGGVIMAHCLLSGLRPCLLTSGRCEAAAVCITWRRDLAFGTLKSVRVACTGDAKRWVDDGPGNASRLLVTLSGFVPERDGCKGNVQSYMIPEEERTEEARAAKRFDDETLSLVCRQVQNTEALMLELREGRREVESYQTLFAIAAPKLCKLSLLNCDLISCLGALVLDALQAYSLVNLTHFEMLGCGNLWSLLKHIISVGPCLRSLVFGWNHEYRSGEPHFDEPVYGSTEKVLAPELRKLILRVPHNKCHYPTTYHHVMWSLLPCMPNLEQIEMHLRYSGNISGKKHGECELEFASGLCKRCPHLKRLTIDQSGTDATLRLFLKLSNLESIVIRSYNNANVTGDGLDDVVCPTLREMDLGSMCSIKGKAGLTSILRACPNLEFFQVNYAKGLADEDAPEIKALLQKIKWASIRGGMSDGCCLQIGASELKPASFS